MTKVLLGSGIASLALSFVTPLHLFLWGIAALFFVGAAITAVVDRVVAYLERKEG
jgi:hypothetical protein